MLYVVSIEDGQLYGAANAIVGTKGSALCRQPFAVNVCLYGVLVEVELNVNKLVAYHVHMALQYHGLPVLVARSSRLADYHVACLVYIGLKSVALAKLLEIVNHLFLTL